MARPKNSLMIINSASNHSQKERQAEDFYATPPRMVKELINYNPSMFLGSPIWEPANGLGHISDTLVELYQEHNKVLDIIRTDIIKRTENTEVFDFLDVNSNNVPEAIKKYESKQYPGTYEISIITNPPYFKGTEFLEKACEIIAPGEMVAFFVKLQYLETKKRYEVFKKYKPYMVLISVQRVHCGKDGQFDNEDASGGAACYCWFIYLKGWDGPTMIDWINTGEADKISNNPLF